MTIDYICDNPFYTIHQPTPSSIDKIVEHDIKRYKSKGVGFIFSIIFFVGFMVGAAELGPILWPLISPASREDIYTHFWVTWTFSVVDFMFVNAIYSILYTIELPFFERYKVTSEPWPWKTDLPAYN
jgi:hypothetical protein